MIAPKFLGGFPEHLWTTPKCSVRPNLEVVASEMQDHLDAFGDGQSRWTEARKLRDGAYVAKKVARDRLRKVMVNIARIQEGYYRLGGATWLIACDSPCGARSRKDRVHLQ